MRQITDEIVTTRMSKPSDQRPQDLLERMLTAADPFTGEKLTAENIQYQLATFLIAGHETTSGLLSFATYELLTHPGVLDTARSLDDVLGNHTPRFEDLAELGYLGQILREALRLHPTAPAFALAPSEPTTLGGYRIEQGEDVMVMLPVLHRDPAVWSDPERFDPDRFAPARMDEIPEYAWMPFGHGARACIGRPFALQEATLVLAMMLQRFDLTFADPRYQMKISETLTIKPKDLAIHVAPRRRDDDIVPASAASQGERPSAEEFAGVAPTADTHGTPLLVLYGSNGGGSESLARTIAADGRARGWASDVAPLDAHVGDLPVEGPVVIVTASYNGTPPDNAREFVTWLTQTRDDLSGVRYLVLGCGSLDWAATYQRVPTVIDEALHAAGATRLRERGATDARTDFFGDWERWYQPLWDDLATAYDLEKVDESGPRYRVVRTDGPDTDHEEVTATVLENRELVRGGPASSKRHLELRLPPGLRYRTGDYLSVLPQNHPELVSRLLTRLRLDPADVVTVESSSPSGRVPIGMPIRVDDLLTRHVDLSSPATPGVVAALSRTTRCPPEREELETLAGDGHADLVLTRRLTLLDLLEAFLSCEVDLAWVLERLPAPRTRQYSISSASEAHSDVSLTVSVVEGPARSGRGTYRGAASHYLQRVRVGERLTVSLASPAEEFRPPRDNSVPIIMIASGSGIAPFRGFVQARLARAAQGEPSGPNVLFFGCRHPDWDDLYAGEFASRVAEGTLEMHRAYSRQPDAGIRYVQHRLLAERGRILDLVHAGAHLYVCGDVSGMGPAVEETLERIGEEAHGAGWLERLRSARRYATDLF